MIKVKVFGTSPPCAKCMESEKRAKTVAERFNGRVEVEKFDALSKEGDKYSVMLTPTIVINDSVISVGKLLTEAEIEKAIRKKIEASP
jgi:hypothetical protein